jgi:hypothetical protein
MELICSSIVLETLGLDFDDYVYLPANGTHGGILLAWKSREIALTEPEVTPNTLMAKVCSPSHTSTMTPWWLTVVYGPQGDTEKIEFLNEIRAVCGEIEGPR